MEVAVPVAGRMIVLASVSPARNITSTDAISETDTRLVDSAKASTYNFKPRETSHRPGIALNRRLAVAIAVPLCFLFLLAVLGIVLFCTRRRRPLRHGTGGRRRSSPEAHRNNFVEPLNTSPAEPEETGPEEQPEWQRPPTAIKRSDDGLSRITEIPSVSDETHDRRSSREIHGLPPSPLVLPPELPSSISSHSETVNPLDSGSDDFGGHFSGLDEDPFSDSAAVSVPKEESPEISPSSQPVQSKPRIDTASSVGAATSESSEHPVTAINTGGPNSVSDELFDEESSRAPSRAISRSPQVQQLPDEVDGGAAPDDEEELPRTDSYLEEAGHSSSSQIPRTANPFNDENTPSDDRGLPQPETYSDKAEQPLDASTPTHDPRLNRLDPRSIPANFGQRSSSVSAKELRQHGQKEDLKTSRSADDILPEDHFLDAFVSPSSSEYPAPPLSDRRSWLEDVTTGEQEGSADEIDTMQPGHGEM